MYLISACATPGEIENTTYERVAPFTLATQKKRQLTEIAQTVDRYNVLEADLPVLNRIAQNPPNEITLIIPDRNSNRNLQLDLTLVNLFRPDFSVRLASNGSTYESIPGAHYQGHISGKDNSSVAVSFFNDRVFGLISDETGNQVLGKLSGGNWTNEHVIYDDKAVLQNQDFDCQTADNGVAYSPGSLEAVSADALIRNCIGIYLEADHDIFTSKGGVQETVNYISGLFNQVKMLFANENINFSLSELLVWDVPSPYSGTSGQMMLDAFKANTDEFNGDIAQLLSFQKGSGGVGEFAGLCKTNPDLRKSFSNISSSYQNIPTYSWSVEVIAHEFGHVMGSKHTHACWWNGNNTAIDGCAEPEEGNCSRPPIPQEGGTIMSYCHLRSVGINFNLGFGPQPGNVMRNNVANATCCTCVNDEDVGDVLAAEGKIALLRVHEVGTKYGPPSDQLDVEVVIWMDSKPYKSFGFKLRDGENEKVELGMLSLLRDAFNRSSRTRIEYTKTGCHTGEIFRVINLD